MDEFGYIPKYYLALLIFGFLRSRHPLYTEVIVQVQNQLKLSYKL